MLWNAIKNALRKDYRSGQYTGIGEDNREAINRSINKGKEFNINRPTSMRTHHKENGSYINDVPFEIGDTTANYDEGEAKSFGVASSAIANARYDPSDDSLNITYTSGPKEYKFKAEGKEGLEEWLDAPSKGRITQEWRNTHRYPGY